MSKRRRSSEGAAIFAALGLVAAAAAGDRISDVETFIAFACLIGVTQLFEVRLPSEVPYSLGLAPALGYTMLGDRGLEVVVAFAIGAAAAAALRAFTGRSPRFFDLATQTIALTLATLLYEAIHSADPLPTFEAGSTQLSPLGLVVVLVTILVAQAALHAARAAETQRIPLTPMLIGQVGATAALQLSVVSVGALLALSFPKLSFYAFALFIAPLAATHFAFRQFAEIRKTYLQTIRALSKVPEMAGYTRKGHSTRVAQLSVDIAREMGLRDADVKEIEYAALLHDIGRVSIPDPDEPHAIEPAELATVGANIVRETGHFPQVADMIERQQDRYRSRSAGSDGSLPIGSRVLKVASAYDDLTHPGPIGLSPLDALDRLHQGMAYDYDPDVIRALKRVLEKRNESSG